MGRGARMAARTAIEAVDAVTSEPKGTARPPHRPSAPEIITPQRARTTQSAAPSRAFSPQDVARATAAATQGVAAPFKRASKALWHELTGCFFALFALSFSAAVWKTRANAVSTVPDTRYRFYAFCALAVIFLYFSVSSFVRARRVT